MNESNPSDAALAELLTLTVEVDKWGDTVYRNHLGQTHRVHGPALIYADGSKFWYKNGLIHRTNSPAVTHRDGSVSWYQNGQYHREDGPALEYADGRKRWYMNGHELTEKEFHERVKSL